MKLGATFSPAKFFLFSWALLLPIVARGHIGSPNVFFEGQAGAHPVRIVIRPPAVLPGSAQVDVRLGVDGVTNVLVQAALFDAGPEGAPPPTLAVAVAGETNLFNATLWLLREGSYSMEVTVESPRGRGRVVVPLNSAATQRPAMSPLLGAVLAALGLMLFLGAVSVIGAAARESVLDPGAAPQAGDHTRARLVAVGSAVLLAGAIYGIKIRWQIMDREFRNNALAKPLPVIASVRTNGTLHLLRLSPPADRSGPAGWDTLVADHGKLMHLFLVHEPDLNAFAHLHPVRRDSLSFESVLPPLPAGHYELYAEITQENGLSQTLTANIFLDGFPGRAPQLGFASNMLTEAFCQSVIAPPGNAAQPFALDADDSWHIGPAAPRNALSETQRTGLMGGYTMVFEQREELLENRELSLRFAVLSPDGAPAALQTYMGMLGHAVLRRSGGEVFTHLHPLGTISMAAQELFAKREASGTLSSTPASQGAKERPVNEVAFPYAFPRAGDYRLWVQVRIDGRVLTGAFNVEVKPGLKR